MEDTDAMMLPRPAVCKNICSNPDDTLVNTDTPSPALLQAAPCVRSPSFAYGFAVADTMPRVGSLLRSDDPTNSEFCLMEIFDTCLRHS